jgi:hypothetical protein
MPLPSAPPLPLPELLLELLLDPLPPELLLELLLEPPLLDVLPLELLLPEPPPQEDRSRIAMSDAAPRRIASPG